MAIFGIDLGTTNSLIAEFSDDGPKLIPNPHGEVLTPSVVGLGDDGTILVGQAARERLLTHPDKTVASFKRFMGSDHITKLGSHKFRPEELSALVLKSLKADAEAHSGQTVDEVVISVPAYFNDIQRKATMDAGKLAGLTVKRIINEPTAAALAYGLNEKKEGKFLVFDLGGGTFDVSIIDQYEGVMEVRATTGDTQLGGNDFTSTIEEMLLAKHDLKRKSLTLKDLAFLTLTADRLKIALSQTSEATYQLQLKDQLREGMITRADFDAAITDLLRKLRLPTERAIADADLSPQDLDAVILVGGATRMPAVRSLVARLFGRLPLMHLDPDTTIALGAAVQVGLVARNAALDDVIMTDVCPYTLGVATISREAAGLEVVSPILQRNMIVPVSRSESYTTVRDGQRNINIEVYQGENLRPEDNVLLGKIEMHVPAGPAGKECVEVRFTYDLNGALEVIVTIVSTNVTRKAIFKNNSGLSEAELQQRFAALESIKLHPRDQVENRALLNRAERLYAENLGDRREEILQAIRQFSRAIEDGNNRHLDDLRASFANFLDNYETFRFNS